MANVGLSVGQVTEPSTLITSSFSEGTVIFSLYFGKDSSASALDIETARAVNANNALLQIRLCLYLLVAFIAVSPT